MVNARPHQLSELTVFPGIQLLWMYCRHATSYNSCVIKSRCLAVRLEIMRVAKTYVYLSCKIGSGHEHMQESWSAFLLFVSQETQFLQQKLDPSNCFNISVRVGLHSSSYATPKHAHTHTCTHT